MRRLGRKGAEFTVTTLIVIVLAIIVLVVLALGFGAGWSNLWSKITGFFSPVNVDATKQACQYACSSESTFAYCCQIRDVRFEKGGDIMPMTCDSGKSRLEHECDIGCEVLTTCQDLLCSNGEARTGCLATEKEDTTKKFSKEGIVLDKQKCCVLKTATLKTCANFLGVWTAGNCAAGKTDKTADVTDTTDKSANTNKKCCV